MPKVPNSRPLDIVLYGATGFTGVLVAKHLAANAPRDTRWAIAGRSQAKLDAVRPLLADLQLRGASKITTVVADSFDKQALDALAQSTKVVITAVGPYALYGDGLVGACARNGTHYVDLAGEPAWIKKSIHKWDQVAKQSGAALIHACGFEFVPQDMSIWTLCRFINIEIGEWPVEVDFCIRRVKAAVSGGTLSSALTMMETSSLAEIQAAQSPYYLCPEPSGPSMSATKVRNVPHVGTGAGWVGESVNRALINRSWSLLEGEPKFVYRETILMSNRIYAFFFWLACTLSLALLILPPVRWLLRRFGPQVGSGPNEDLVENGFVEATVQATTRSGRCAFMDLRIQRDPGYGAAAIMIAEAGLLLVNWEGSVEAPSTGSITPACLGNDYWKRLLHRNFAASEPMWRGQPPLSPI